MHIAVLGAGVIGVTTAYFLSKAGHEVTVIERDGAVGKGCSFANGGQLSYSYTDAMASPAFLAKAPGLLAGIDPAIRVRPPLSMDLLRWGGQFVRECTTAQARANTLANLTLGIRSEHLLRKVRQELEPSFAFRKAGKIVLLRSEGERRNAVINCHLKNERGIETRVIGLDEAINIEPAIASMAGPYVAAVYSQGDDVGDAHRFTTAVGDYLQAQRHCKFQLQTTVEEIIAERHRVYAIATDKGRVDVDAVVVSLGSQSPGLLRPLGIDPGIVPARGYSVTLPQGKQPVSVSVTDFAKRFVISRIDDQMRIAGFADFVGHSTHNDQRRIGDLLRVARSNAPRAADYSTSANNAWGGFRPLTANGLPRIGPTAVSGLYLNTGHGSLGWTLACASAEKITNLISPDVVASQTLAA